MSEGRWIDSDDPADEAFVEHAVRALREDVPDEAHMRLLEQRLPAVLAGEAARSPWWRRPHVHLMLGITVAVVAGVFATRGSPQVVVTPLASAIPSSPAIAPASERAPPALPAISVDALPSAPAVVSPAVALAPRPKAVPSSSPSPSPSPSSLPSPSPSPSSSPVAETRGDELAILEAATSALDVDPARALALTAAHASRFPAPKFAEERERLAIHALVHLGRHAEAVERAAAFEAAYPRSTHLTRIRGLVHP